MPTIPKPKNPLIPDWIEEPSVFDPMYKKAIRTAVNALGISNDPTGSLPTPNVLTPTIALIRPDIARKNGEALIKLLKEEGLRQTTGGMPAREVPGYWESVKRIIGLKPKPSKMAPGVPVPPHVMEALEFAQKRWPRLFGQQDEIKSIDNLDQMLSGNKISGNSANSRRFVNPDSMQPVGSTSVMGLSVPHLPTREEASNTIGHELLHTADRLTNPEFESQYHFSNKLPGGYVANSNEIRARLQGARTEAYIQGAKRKQVEPIVSATSSKYATLDKTHPDYELLLKQLMDRR